MSALREEDLGQTETLEGYVARVYRSSRYEVRYLGRCPMGQLWWSEDAAITAVDLCGSWLAWNGRPRARSERTGPHPTINAAIDAAIGIYRRAEARGRCDLLEVQS